MKPSGDPADPSDAADPLPAPTPPPVAIHLEPERIAAGCKLGLCFLPHGVYVALAVGPEEGEALACVVVRADTARVIADGLRRMADEAEAHQRAREAGAS